MILVLQGAKLILVVFQKLCPAANLDICVSHMYQASELYLACDITYSNYRRVLAGFHHERTLCCMESVLACYSKKAYRSNNNYCTASRDPGGAVTGCLCFAATAASSWKVKV